MDTRQFERLVRQKAQEIEKYAQLEFPVEAGNTALRFIDGNFRAQGWQGSSFKRWKPNKRKGRILVKRGHLRNANYYVTSPGMATVRNTMPYAKIHNEGGTIDKKVTVKAFTKKAYTRKKSSGRGRVKVRSHIVGTHTRQMNLTMPQRQFAPTDTSTSPVLNNAVERNVVKAFKKIFGNI